MTIIVAITLDDGSVRRMQVVKGADIDVCVKKTPWAAQVKGWREASPDEFPAGCTWRDEGGKIVGVPIPEPEPPRDLAAELDALKAQVEIMARGQA